MITNDVSDYINLLVRNAHIIYNHPILFWVVLISFYWFQWIHFHGRNLPLWNRV